MEKHVPGSYLHFAIENEMKSVKGWNEISNESIGFSTKIQASAGIRRLNLVLSAFVPSLVYCAP